MTFKEFLMLLPLQNDITIAAFQNWANTHTTLPDSSDPRVLAKALFKNLDHNLTAGYIKAIMLYSSMPNNEIPKKLQENEDMMLEAINHIVELKHPKK